MTGTVVLIVAAGRGHRVGGEIPKQYVELNGLPILYRTVQAFKNSSPDCVIRVVIHPDDRSLYDDAVRDLELLDPVSGGATRQESVRLGLESLVDLEPELVLIHDAARPFIDGKTIERVITALGSADGALPVLPVTDTLKRSEGDNVVATVDRSTIWRAQTPQGFHYNKIREAHQQVVGKELTDDASVAELAKLEVVMVEGDQRNIKVTTVEDLARPFPANQSWETRVGSGFDVHRFKDGDFVTLCGIKVPHDKSLEGHSDADVALHALTDAILGAIGMGDIGQHFPPSEEKWRGAPSDQFLAYAVKLLKQHNGEIGNIDLTIICEAPKIGAHRVAMEERLSQILETEIDRINVKATTTEKLGFTGRGEGIAAQATASVKIGSIV
jgi:2-C-methyl-D-erythritol 4-phosphate cytidylyltransferase/2-C-methyl-D-erythritol 2,4-cyclodiphosphate synthase